MKSGKEKKEKKDLRLRTFQRLESTYGTHEAVEILHENAVYPFSKCKIIILKAMLKELFKR